MMGDRLENRAPTREKQGCVSKSTGFPEGFYIERFLRHPLRRAGRQMLEMNTFPMCF